ncbi:MAG: Mov34/MPN/PAD-1 family protein [Myxococcales bacterium]
MIPAEALGQIVSHAQQAYPAECCGLLLEDASGALRFQAIRNVAGTAAGAATSGRSARDGYVMEPKALLQALEATEQAGGRLWAIVHSHPDAGAYFSNEDKNMALGGGDSPLWPGVRYLVVSVRAARADDARIYAWDDASREFREEKVPLDAGLS